jgi:hypothetical protein
VPSVPFRVSAAAAGSFTQKPPIQPPRTTTTTTTARRRIAKPGEWNESELRRQTIWSIEEAMEPMPTGMIECMYRQEQLDQPFCYYMLYQQNITESHRMDSIKVMMQIASAWCLSRETLHLAVRYWDRYMTHVPSSKKGCTFTEPATATTASVFYSGVPLPVERIDLLNMACIWLASKMADDSTPTANDLLVAAENRYSLHQLVLMEKILVRVLCANASSVTTNTWLGTYLRAMVREITETCGQTSVSSMSMSDVSTNSWSTTRDVVHSQQQIRVVLSKLTYIQMMESLDLVMMHPHVLRFYPSACAASILYLRYGPGHELHDIVRAATAYDYDDLQPCIDFMQRLLSRYVYQPWLPWTKEQTTVCQKLFLDSHDRFHLAHYNKHMYDVVCQVWKEDIANKGSKTVYCHTNISQSAPLFLRSTIVPNLHARSLIRPIRAACRTHVDEWGMSTYERLVSMSPTPTSPLSSSSSSSSSSSGDLHGSPMSLQSSAPSSPETTDSLSSFSTSDVEASPPSSEKRDTLQDCDMTILKDKMEQGARISNRDCGNNKNNGKSNDTMNWNVPSIFVTS